VKNIRTSLKSSEFSSQLLNKIPVPPSLLSNG